MPIANNMAELKQMLRSHLTDAMNVVNQKVLTDMYDEVGNFYTLGHPTIYVRTGGLASSPRTTSLNISGDYISFDAYLDQNQGWYGRNNPNPAFTSKGYKSYFSPLQILNAAEYHFAHVKGRPGFWGRSQQKFEKEIRNTMNTFFN